MESATNNHHPPSSPELDAIEERERSVALLSFMPEVKSLTIYCSRTGEAIANMQLIQQAGRMPYLANWKDAQAYHPLFSLPQPQLLAWVRKNWNTLFRGNASDSITDTQKKQFRIAFMAILHSLNCIDQQHPALPTFDVVNTNMQRLLELAYWYNYLGSKRFRFPTLRINKLNANLNLSDIHVYFDICDSVRHDWESSKEGKAEDAKLEAARKAERTVRGGHVRAISKKALWNWFLSSMNAGSSSKKYQQQEWTDWKEYSAKIWFATEAGQLKYSVDDINQIEGVFLAECTLGTTVSHAFNSELSKIRDRINDHNKIFSIDWNETARANVQRVSADGTITPVTKTGAAAPAHPGINPPDPNTFPKRWLYLQAKAKYDVALLQYNAWQETYGSQEESNDEQTETPEDSDEESDTDREDENDDQAGQ